MGDARGQELRQDVELREEIPASLASQVRSRDRMRSRFDLVVTPLCLSGVYDDPPVKRKTGVYLSTDLCRKLLAAPPSCSEETLDWSVANPAAPSPRAALTHFLARLSHWSPRLAAPRRAMPCWSPNTC